MRERLLRKLWNFKMARRHFAPRHFAPKDKMPQDKMPQGHFAPRHFAPNHEIFWKVVILPQLQNYGGHYVVVWSDSPFEATFLSCLQSQKHIEETCFGLCGSSGPYFV